VSQVERWESEAARWAELVRTEGEEWADFIVEAFWQVLPSPGTRTLDVACGEGRLARRLRRSGHQVMGIDASPTMIRLAREADPAGDYRVADAGALPLPDASVDLVVAYMCLQDLDDPAAALAACSRVLVAGGRLCLAIIHPFWSALDLGGDGDSIRVRGSYFDTVEHVRPVLQVPSVHRPLEAYVQALEEAGLLIESLRELPSTSRLVGLLPSVLLLRTVKPAAGSHER
jgi:ubiquinone/menaquinone biosynthesis C-methylase UbiE